MKYKSTRNSGSQEFTFEEALLRGYAPDGGLFVPISLPVINEECLRSWSKLTYPELAYSVLVGTIILRDLFCFHSVNGIGIVSCISPFSGSISPANVHIVVRNKRPRSTRYMQQILCQGKI